MFLIKFLLLFSFSGQREKETSVPIHNFSLWKTQFWSFLAQKKYLKLCSLLRLAKCNPGTGYERERFWKVSHFSLSCNCVTMKLLASLQKRKHKETVTVNKTKSIEDCSWKLNWECFCCHCSSTSLSFKTS